MIAQESFSCGSGDFLIEAAPGMKSFYAAFGLGTDDMFLYTIASVDGLEWEHGAGFLKDPATLVRKSVIVSSAGPCQRLSFMQGRKRVFNGGGRAECEWKA